MVAGDAHGYPGRGGARRSREDLLPKPDFFIVGAPKCGTTAMVRYLEASETEDRELRAEIMDEILTYNREDLEATWAVLEWLRGLR